MEAGVRKQAVAREVVAQAMADHVAAAWLGPSPMRPHLSYSRVLRSRLRACFVVAGRRAIEHCG